MENAKGVPGTPDILFPRHKLVIFFHGCFWHFHDCKEFDLNQIWLAKQASRRLKDSRVRDELVELGFDVLIVWECHFNRDPARIVKRIRERVSLLTPLE